MQTESELKKHEFRIIYIIAEKNCTISGGGIFGETFIMWELCPLRRRDLWKRRDDTEGGTDSVHSSMHHNNISQGDSDFGRADLDQPLLYHWWKRYK